MSLPEILPPGSLPCFLAEGHDIDPRDVFAAVPSAVGSGRKRRIRTAACRTMRVGWVLDVAQMAELDDWFENVLLAGERHFTAKVANQGPGRVFWDAVWQAPYTSDPMPAKFGPLWRVTGVLYLSGEGSATGPDATSLAVEFGLALEGSAYIVGDASLAVEFGLALLPDSPLAIEFGLALVAIVNGAFPSVIDQDERWSWLGFPYAPGHTSDLADEVAAQRNWMGF